MNVEHFDATIQEQLDYCCKLLCNKGHEYNEGDVDRLATFKRAAAMMECTDEQALAGMMIKHTASIYQMIAHPENNYSIEKWTEKITDHINYLLLLKAVICEKMEEYHNV